MATKKEIYLQDVEDIKNSLSIQRSGSSRIIAFAVHKGNLNCYVSIPAYEGISITNEVYDSVNDEYLINCYSTLDLGIIDECYQIGYEGDYTWRTNICMPRSVVERHLNQEQKSAYTKWLQSMNKEEFVINFLQMVIQ